MTAPQFYFQTFYPLQDQVLKIINSLDTGLYLTGGTTVSRAYLHHRFSDDLDFFVNDDDQFGLWADRVFHALTQNWKMNITLRDVRFARCIVYKDDIPLKIEMVNDVPSRVGDIRQHPILGRIDSPENILANKVTAALDRHAAKDLADIWGLCLKMNLSLETAIYGVQGKAIGVFPADLARVLCSVTTKDWELVRWIDPPPVDRYLAELSALGEKLLLIG